MIRRVSLHTFWSSELPSDPFVTDANLHLAIPIFVIRFEATTAEEHVCCLVVYPFLAPDEPRTHMMFYTINDKVLLWRGGDFLQILLLVVN